MNHFEYLNIKIAGSKGCVDARDSEEIAWNNVRLIITKNGLTTVQNLAGGIERIEDHLNNQLTHYEQQGWQAISVERHLEQGKKGNHNMTICCFLKRSIQLESSNLFENLTKSSTRIYRDVLVGA
jgi:hypothetical protein